MQGLIDNFSLVRYEHEQALEYAYDEAQITSIPTFIIGNERIEGAADKVLIKALEEASNTRLIVVGGAVSLFVDVENPKHINERFTVVSQN